MTSKRSLAIKTRILSAFVLFLAALTVLLAFAALAQEAVMSQASAKSSATTVPGVGSAEHDAVRRLQMTREDAGAMTSANFLSFLSAVGYDSGGYVAVSVAVADVSGDGKPDVIVANGCGSSSSCNYYVFGFDGTVAVLLGNGDGTFQPAVAYASGGKTPVSVNVSDVDGDGKPDLRSGERRGGRDDSISGDGSLENKIQNA